MLDRVIPVIGRDILVYFGRNLLGFAARNVLAFWQHRVAMPPDLLVTAGRDLLQRIGSLVAVF